MKPIVLAWACLFFLAASGPVSGQWLKTYGGPGSEIGYALPTSDGGYVLAGSTTSYGTLQDAWVLKLDPAGRPEWQRSFGGPQTDAASHVRQTSDGGFLVAGSTRSYGAGESDVWLLKLTSAGAVAWQKTYGGSDDDSAAGLVLADSGEAYVSANTESFNAATRGRDFWVFKISSTGDLIWQRQYGGSGSDSCSNLEPADDGGLFVAGTGAGFFPSGPDYPQSVPWILKLDSNGNIVWQKRYGLDAFFYLGGSRCVRRTSDGGLIVAGHTPEMSRGATDVFVWKLDSGGTMTWHRQFGTTRPEFGGPVIQTKDGGYAVLAGTGAVYQYGEDIILLKLSAAGDLQWQRGLGGSQVDTGTSLHQLADGRFVYSGVTESFGSGGRDLLLVKTFPEGDIDPACPYEAPFAALSGGSIPGGTATTRTALATTGVALTAPASSAATAVVPVTLCFTTVSPPGGLALARRINRNLFRKEAMHTLTWSAGSANPRLTISEYRVYRREAGQGDGNLVLLGSVAGPGLRYEDKFLDPAKRYVYVVTAVESGGLESAYSQPVGN